MRKKRIIFCIAAVSVAVCMAVGLSACTVVEEHTHIWDDGVSTATCTESGETTYTCTECGETVTVPTAAFGHNYTVTTSVDSCNEVTVTYECSRCGDKETKTAGTDGHVWAETGTTATCTAAGKTTYTCSVCGETKEETAAALGHDYVAGTKTVTCDKVTTEYECTRCGDKKTETETADVTGHVWTETGTTATCTEAGTTTYTCDICGATKEESTDALGHDIITETEAVCEGVKITSSCSRCDYCEETVIDALGHEYTSSTTATCTEDGVTTYTCSRCGASYTEDTPALGHDYVLNSSTATCTAAGTDTYKCSRCNDEYTVEVAAHHSWDEGVTDPDTGITTYTCSVCEGTYSEKITGEGEVVSIWDGDTSDYSWLDTAATYDEGTTYEIGTAAQLAGLAGIVNGDYSDITSREAETLFDSSDIVLEADIDLEGENWTPIGTALALYDTFTGTFDGNSHTISNLSINVTMDNIDPYAGLFGFIEQAEIKNVTIENAVVSDTVFGYGVGVIAGWCDSQGAEEGSLIKNCAVTGLVQVTGNISVGGIMGEGLYTTIENCSVCATEDESFIKAVNSVYLTDTDAINVGGIAGTIVDTLVSSVYNSVEAHVSDVSVSGLEISGDYYVGGLIGYVKNQAGFYIGTDSEESGIYGNFVSNCVITVNGLTTPYVGAIVGYSHAAITISGCSVSATVNYTDADYVYSGDSSQYAGFYGGGLITIENCTGSVILVDSTAVTDGN